MPFVRAYPRETQEMVFDAHDKAFAFFGGACARGIYDNMKTAVDTIFVGKDRAYANRFHHDTNPAWQTVLINDAELVGYSERTLKFCSRT